LLTISQAISLVGMDSASAILNEAYQRLQRNGPEFGGDERGDHGLTNHGPMVVEVICRRGLEIDVHRWLDRYTGRLTGLPTRRRLDCLLHRPARRAAMA
jgi:hypothetical protein